MVSRKGDIMIVVCQNNDEKNLIIEKVDAAIENIIGYEAEELVGKCLSSITLPAVTEILSNYLSYDSEGEDLANVLAKVRDFGFLTKLGYEVKVNMRVNRVVTDGLNPKFEVIIKDHSEVSEGSKSALRNFRGRQIIDKNTGLPDRESFNKEAEFINFCISKNRIVASFAVISIDGIENFEEQYGKDHTTALMTDMVSRCKMNFREDDIFGSIGDNMIGVILLEAHAAIARNPLNRLRWQVASQPFALSDSEEVSVTLSIAFAEIKTDRLVDDAVHLCQDKLKELRISGGNNIAEIV